MNDHIFCGCEACGQCHCEICQKTNENNKKNLYSFNEDEVERLWEKITKSIKEEKSSFLEWFTALSIATAEIGDELNIEKIEFIDHLSSIWDDWKELGKPLKNSK